MADRVDAATLPRDARSRAEIGAPSGVDVTDLRGRYRSVRSFTETLCEPLSTEDYVVQTMESVSPTKWHLAHVSWFFETFLLRPHLPGYEPVDDDYAYLFNSYYVQAGERHCRDRRGWISRPTVEEVYAFRAHVDEAMDRLLEGADGETLGDLAPLLEIGLNHEQQHQELLLTDIKHVFSVNPLRPAYRDDAAPAPGTAPALEWVSFEGGVHEIGRDAEGLERGRDFCYDNETPRHREYLDPFALANRPVTCGEYLEFMQGGGYERPELWLSAGWATVEEKEWTEPFYWQRKDGRWQLYTLGGMRDVREDEPVSHLTYFEADAFARWAGARLPTEAEWEVAARDRPLRGNFVESAAFHPTAAGAGGAVSGGGPAGATAGRGEDAPEGLLQLFGDVWEWTRSHYSPYPGYEPLPGVLGEYNGKFMCGQFVLRGGSCATSASHVRPTYRNFFHPDEAWQFTGLRLAKDA